MPSPLWLAMHITSVAHFDAVGRGHPPHHFWSVAPLWLRDQGVTLPEQLHVQISFGRPARAGDMAQPGRRQVDGGVAIRKSPDARTSADLAHVRSSGLLTGMRRAELTSC